MRPGLPGERRQVDARVAVDGPADGELGRRRPGTTGWRHRGVCPSPAFTTSLTAPPVIVTCAVTCFPVGAPSRPRPEYSLDVPSAHCCIHQETSAHPLADRHRTRRISARRSAQPLGGGRDPLVGRREREPHVLGEVHAVEVARAAEDAEVGEPRDRVPRVAALGGPEVEPALAAVDAEARRLEGRASAGRAARGSAAFCSATWRRRRARRSSPPAAARQHESRVLAHGREPGDRLGGIRRRTRRGSRPCSTASRASRWRACGGVAVGHPRVEQARHGGSSAHGALPAQLGVALVADDDGAELARPVARARGAPRRRAPARRGCPASSARRAASFGRPLGRVVGRQRPRTREAPRPSRRSGTRPAGARPRRPRRGRAGTAAGRRAPSSRSSAARCRVEARHAAARANHSTIAARRAAVPTVCG